MDTVLAVCLWALGADGLPSSPGPQGSTRVSFPSTSSPPHRSPLDVRHGGPRPPRMLTFRPPHSTRPMTGEHPGGLVPDSRELRNATLVIHPVRPVTSHRLSSEVVPSVAKELSCVPRHRSYCEKLRETVTDGENIANPSPSIPLRPCRVPPKSHPAGPAWQTPGEEMSCCKTPEFPSRPTFETSS